MVGIDAPGIVATAVEEFLQPFVPDALDQLPLFPLTAGVVYANIARCAMCNVQVNARLFEFGPLVLNCTEY